MFPSSPEQIIKGIIFSLTLTLYLYIVSIFQMCSEQWSCWRLHTDHCREDNGQVTVGKLTNFYTSKQCCCLYTTILFLYVLPASRHLVIPTSVDRFPIILVLNEPIQDSDPYYYYITVMTMYFRCYCTIFILAGLAGTCPVYNYFELHKEGFLPVYIIWGNPSPSGYIQYAHKVVCKNTKLFIVSICLFLERNDFCWEMDTEYTCFMLP